LWTFFILILFFLAMMTHKAQQKEIKVTYQGPGHRNKREVMLCVCALSIISCAVVCFFASVVTRGKQNEAEVLEQAPPWVVQQELAAEKSGLVDKLENSEKEDQATIAAIQQRLRIVSERNKWLVNKYKSLKAYKGIRGPVGGEGEPGPAGPQGYPGAPGSPGVGQRGKRCVCARVRGTCA